MFCDTNINVCKQSYHEYLYSVPTIFSGLTVSVTPSQITNNSRRVLSLYVTASKMS